MPNPSIARYRRKAIRENARVRDQQRQQTALYRAFIAQSVNARENSNTGCIRMGVMPTNIPIQPGVPEPLGSLVGHMPDPIATARTNGLALENMSALAGLALENEGDLGVVENAKIWWDDSHVIVKAGVGIGALYGVWRFAKYMGY